MAVVSSSSMGSWTIVGQQLTDMEWVCSPVRRGSRSQAAIGVVRRKSSGRWRGNSKSGVGGNEVQNHNGIAAISVLKLLQRWKADVVAGLNRSVATWAVRSSNYAVPLVFDDHNEFRKSFAGKKSGLLQAPWHLFPSHWSFLDHIIRHWRHIMRKCQILNLRWVINGFYLTLLMVTLFRVN